MFLGIETIKSHKKFFQKWTAKWFWINNFKHTYFVVNVSKPIYTLQNAFNSNTLFIICIILLCIWRERSHSNNLLFLIGQIFLIIYLYVFDYFKTFLNFKRTFLGNQHYYSYKRKKFFTFPGVFKKYFQLNA